MNQPDPLPELLSKRELEILALLVENKTNQEIADQLHLALSSVKWYAGEIYGKLGVENRRQAVKKAAELGLLSKPGLLGKPGLLEKPGHETQKPSFPSGIVTFLFTDIEGSTPLWEQMPDAMREAVAQHHALLRQAIEANGGHIFQVVGDAFQAAFRLASEGLCAALAAQRALRDAHWGPTDPLKVRMGLHAGPAELDSHGDAPYQVGHTLNRVARIMSAGYGGQILLSQEAADLVERELPEGISLLDLGQHHLKGMQHSEHLYQLIAPDLPHHFPRLATGVAHPHNLPAQLTSFIGREKELAALEDLFLSRAVRLVTLTGSGGTGKTRLALKAAETLLELFPQGVWLVELAPISDPLLIPRAVADVLGVREGAHENLSEALAIILQNRQTLLILDNCEHVVSDAAALAGQLLHHCPHLHILATSREILGVEGEVPFRVPSLSLPKGKLPVAELAQYEAVRLFVERARLASPSFALTEGNAPLVERICRRLDGIPLAIELAAARTRMLSLDQIAARLDQAFRLLTGGSRSALPRHQTLRALIDWSYNLLSEPERILLRRLSVFSGGWTLEAAESVCADQTLLSMEQVLDLLGQLIDKSLVQMEQEQAESAPQQSEPGSEELRSEEPRYRMLETVRQYAREKLASERLVESGGVEALRERHLDYFLDLSLQAQPNLRTRHMRKWLDLLDRELDNLRLALEWAVTGSVGKGLRLATALREFWHLRDHQTDGLYWLDNLLDAEEAQFTGNEKSSRSPAEWAIRGRALYTWSFNATLRILGLSGKYQQRGLESLTIFQKLCAENGDAYLLDLNLARLSIASTHQDELECLEGFQALHQPFYIAESFMYLALIASKKYNLVAATRYNEESLALRREIGDLDGEGFALFLSAFYLYYAGKYDQAIEFVKESIRIYEDIGNRATEEFPRSLYRLILITQGNDTQALDRIEMDRGFGRGFNSPFLLVDTYASEGWVAWALKDYDRAVLTAQKSLEVGENLPLPWRKLSLYVLGRVALSQGNFSLAREYFFQTITPTPITQMFNDFRSYQALGVLAAAQQEYRRAATILGAQIGIAAWTLNLMCPAERSEYEHALGDARNGLGEEAFTTAWEEGRAMTEEQLRQYARESLI